MKNAMKRYGLWVLLIPALVSCGEEEFTGSGNIITVIREVEAFSSIEANNALEVKVSQGPNQLVEVTVNDNLQNQILTQVSNGTLVIALVAGSFDNATFVVNVQVPDLDRFRLNDATRATISFDTDQLDLSVNDAANLRLEGTADTLNISSDNAALVSGFSFSADVVNVTSRGASAIEITCNSELNGTVRDAARVLYKGFPEIKATTSDAGRITNSN